MNKTEMILAQAVRLLTEIRDEIRAANRIAKRATDQQIAENKTKQRQMRRQTRLIESQRRK